MDQGTAVGLLAQNRYPNGVEISLEHWDILGAVELTKKTINDGCKTIYEATAITPDGDYCRIDIFNKVGENEWDLIEVKSSLSVKDYYYEDIAFQRYVFESAGYKIRKSILMHINGEYVRKGDINVNDLFIEVDLTEQSIAKRKDIEQNLKSLNTILKSETAPSIKISDHCSNPNGCDYTDYCWRDVPEYSVYNLLSRSKAKRDLLISQGIIDVKDIPEDFELTDNQMLDYVCHKTGRANIQKDDIKQFLDRLEYPLYYLDYETIWPAIPLFDGASPYKQIPFQFSLHMQNKKDGKLQHVEFLNQDSTDPRPALAKSLVENIGDTGSVIVYNQNFEESRNKELMEVFPEYKDKLDSINKRMVDLLVPFRSRYLYDPKMNGSASIKQVLPTFVPELSYQDLEIGDGGDASKSYIKTLDPETSQEEKEKIYKALKAYCGLDTLAMVKLIEVLQKAISI